MLAAVLAAASGCGEKVETISPKAATAVPAPAGIETRAVVANAEGAAISVEIDDGWDAAFVAKQVAGEVALCREVMSSKIGIAPDPRAILAIDVVHDARALERARNEAPAPWMLRFDDRASFRAAPARLVLTRDVETQDRTYLFMLALLLTQPSVAPVSFVDSVASWGATLVLNKLRDDPSWARGRPPLADLRPGMASLDTICEWGCKPLVTFDDPLVAAESRSIDSRATPRPADVRKSARCLAYFLATYDADADRHARFAGAPRHAALLKRLIAKEDGPEPAKTRALLDEAGVQASDFEAYIDLVIRKLALGHFRHGVILAWSEYENRRGERTGKLDDDALR